MLDAPLGGTDPTEVPAGGDASEAIVVGAGFGGMAAALRLRARGYRVTLIDRCPKLGGRAQAFERDGYRFDAGPTVITAPFLFDELFALFGRRREDYVPFLPVKPWYRFRFADGETFDYGGTIEETLEEIGRISPDDREGYRRLLAASQEIFRVGFEELADRPFHRLSTMLAQVPALLRLRADRSVWQLVCRHLKDDRLRRAFSIQPLLVGGNPFDTTCIYSLIHFLERKWGVSFPEGGTGALVDALGRLMGEVGIDIRLGTTVESIAVEEGRARGVDLASGERLAADLVVSNVDPLHLYRSMLPAGAVSASAKAKARWSSPSMGLYVLFFGTDRQWPEVAHHTIAMGERYRGLLADIFHKKRLAEDFSLYLHRPTATDPSFAPAGHDSFYVLAPVPNLRGDVDWAREGERFGDRILAELDRTLLPGVRDAVTTRFHMSPADFAHDYLSVDGAGFSVAPLFRQSAWFRFHNKAEGIDGLYLTGAGTHPGAGLPGVVSSAKVVDRLVPDPVIPWRRTMAPPQTAMSARPPVTAGSIVEETKAVSIANPPTAARAVQPPATAAE